MTGAGSRSAGPGRVHVAQEAAAFWFSFLVGWFVKRSIVKYGGMKPYERLKPLFIGLLAGEFIGALVPMVIGFLYYAFTGEMPRAYRVFPM